MAQNGAMIRCVIFVDNFLVLWRVRTTDYRQQTTDFGFALLRQDNETLATPDN